MDNTLDQFNEDIKHNAIPIKTIELDRGTVFPYNREELLAKMKSLDNMTEEEVYNLLSKEYSIIFSEIFNSKSIDYIFLLKSTKFLTIMTQVIASHQIIYDDKVHLNNFIYNYLINTEDIEEDGYLKHLLFMLGEALNKVEANRLLGCELDPKLAIFLAVTLKSTFNPIINIRRFNFTLSTAIPQIATVEKIIEIYESMFDNVTDLITAILFDDTFNNANYDWVTPEITNANNNILSAALTILESLVPYELTKVLQSISYEFKWKNCEEGICLVDFDKLDPKVFIKTCIILDQLRGEGYIFP